MTALVPTGLRLKSAAAQGKMSAFPSPHPALLPTVFSGPALPEPRFSQDSAHAIPKQLESSSGFRCLQISTALKAGKVGSLAGLIHPRCRGGRVDNSHMQCPFSAYFQDQAPLGFPLRPPRASLKCRQMHGQTAKMALSQLSSAL